MQQKFKRFYGSMKNKAVVAGALLLGSVSTAFAQTAPDTTAATTAITNAETAVLAIVAAGGAAMVAIALGKVVWVAGAKFVSRLSGKA